MDIDPRPDDIPTTPDDDRPVDELPEEPSVPLDVPYDVPTVDAVEQHTAVVLDDERDTDAD